MSPARGPTLLKQADFSKNNEENSMCQLHRDADWWVQQLAGQFCDSKGGKK